MQVMLSQGKGIDGSGFRLTPSFSQCRSLHSLLRVDLSIVGTDCMDTVTITVNDEQRAVPTGETVATLVQRLALKAQGIAVALNAEVVPQPHWNEYQLKSNDSVLIIMATQGG